MQTDIKPIEMSHSWNHLHTKLFSLSIDGWVSAFTASLLFTTTV